MDVFSYPKLVKGTLKSKGYIAEKSVKDFRKEILAKMDQMGSGEVEAFDVVLADLRTLISESKAEWKALEYHNLLHAIVHLWAIGKAAGSEQERRFIDEQYKKLTRKCTPPRNDASKKRRVGRANLRHP